MQFKPDSAEAGPVTASRRPLVHRDHIGLGMAAGAGAFFMMSTMSVFAKLLSPTHWALEVAFYRNAIAAIPFAIWFLFLGRRDLFKVNSRVDMLIVRSVIGTVSLIATFKAFNYLPLADAQVLFFTSSLFIPIMGSLFLSEHVGPYRWSAIAIGFLGMLVSVRPSGAVNLTGVLLAVTAAMMHSILSTLLRVLGRTERPETVTFYFVLIGAALTGLAMPFIATAPTWHEVPLLLGVGISGALGQTLLSVAYKYAPMAIVTIFNYLGIVWATAYGWFIWGDWPSPPVWIGASIIIASSLFIVWRENKMAKLRKLLPPEPTELP